MGGGGGGTNLYQPGGGGGYINCSEISVTSNQSIDVIVGAGGTGKQIDGSFNVLFKAQVVSRALSDRTSSLLAAPRVMIYLHRRSNVDATAEPVRVRIVLDYIMEMWPVYQERMAALEAQLVTTARVFLIMEQA